MANNRMWVVNRKTGAKAEMTLGARLGELILRYGSMRAVGRVLEIDHAYLSRLYHGAKKAPSERVLKKLGMERVVTYRRKP